MDAKHSGEIYRVLEKQGDLLEEARRSIVDELQKLAVEQEMLMRKSYDVRQQQMTEKKKKEHDDNIEHTDTGGETEKDIAEKGNS